MAAEGKVLIGFSHPYVALYTASGSTVAYSSGQRLARGVSLQLDVETADDNNFYADNGVAESEAGVFQSGTFTLTVDGLFTSAEALIEGLGTASTITIGTGQDAKTVNVYDYGKNQSIPYVGIGVIATYMSDGDVTYTPIMLPKARFNQISLDMATMEDEIDWQTQELTGTILRDDTTAQNWRRLAEDQDTEAEADEVIRAMLNITTASD